MKKKLLQNSYCEFSPNRQIDWHGSIDGQIHSQYSRTVFKPTLVYEKYIVFVFQSLSMNGIRIKNVSSFAFWGLQHLEKVSIYDCHLSEAPSLVPIASTLRMLDLIGSKLTCLPENYFNECHLLNYINFAINLLTAVPNLRNLNATIKDILLIDNRITNVESLYFVPMTKLKRVDLSNNLILEIVFENTIWPAISVIYLSNNCLTSVNIEGLQGVLRSVDVLLHGNPWHCDVELCWLYHCNFRAGMKPDWGMWSNCPGAESIRLVGDIICKGPDERKYLMVNETGNRFFILGI